jgi:type II secretory pathway component GspD/PulD (secretin)
MHVGDLRGVRAAKSALTLFILAAVPAWPQQGLQLKTYPLGLLDAETATEVVRGLLSPQGRVVEDRVNHQLIVWDHPDRHALIESALREARPEPRNIRIVVAHSAERLEDRRGADVGVGGARRDEPVVRGRASSSRSAIETRQEILVLNGRKASIQVAERVPYEDWFFEWGASHGLWGREVRWRDVGAAMAVEPLLLGDGRLRVRLTPTFSYFVDRERRLSEVHELATEVVVSEGETIDLGGVPVSESEFLDRFLVGVDQGGTRQRVRITLEARVE